MRRGTEHRATGLPASGRQAPLCQEAATLLSSDGEKWGASELRDAQDWQSETDLLAKYIQQKEH